MVEDDIRNIAGGNKRWISSRSSTSTTQSLTFYPRKYKTLESQLLIKEAFVCMKEFVGSYRRSTYPLKQESYASLGLIPVSNGTKPGSSKEGEFSAFRKCWTLGLEGFSQCLQKNGNYTDSYHRALQGHLRYCRTILTLVPRASLPCVCLYTYKNSSHGHLHLYYAIS